MSQLELIPAAGMPRKRCPQCGETKPHADFYRSAKAHDGRGGYCKVCVAGYLREYRQRQPERFARYEQERLARHGEQRREQSRQRWTGQRREDGNRRRRATEIKRAYGIGIEEYEQLVSGACQICGIRNDIVLDHCHATGNIRGPLCRRCNLAIGYLDDDAERLRVAAEYVERHARKAAA